VRIERAVLVYRLQEVAGGARFDNCQSKAPTLDAVAETVDHSRYRSPKPSLAVIKGGKDGQISN
jgi:hypothetical protein